MYEEKYQAKRAAAQQECSDIAYAGIGMSSSAGLSGNGLSANQACDTQTITMETEALLKHLSMIRDAVESIADRLFGPRPEQGNGAKCPAPDSLNARVMTASIMASNIARDVESIKRLI